MRTGLKNSAALPKNTPENAQENGLAGYRRIEIDLRAQVESGRWPVGAMLPSRRDLAQQYAVSLVTLDRAIGPLLADGTLRADDRRGTFVLKLPASPSGTTPSGTMLSPIPLSESAAGQVTSGLVGVLTSHALAQGQEYLVLHELEQVLSQRGLSVQAMRFASSEGHPRRLTETVQAMLREKVAALLVVCFDIDKAALTAELGRLPFGDVPVVCVVAGELPLPIPHVFYDYHSGGYQAVQHLTERGWGQITVFAPFRATWVSERLAGVRAAAAHGNAAPQILPARPADCPEGDLPEWNVFQNPHQLGHQAAQAALRDGWRPDGIVCVNDGVAFGVMDALAEQGLDAGRDYAIVGFDDKADARDRGLTSLRPPIQGLAREAARLLLDHMQGLDTGLQIRLRAHVIPRASTRRRPSPAAS